MDNKKNLVLIGSSSELAKEFISINSQFNLYQVTSNGKNQDSNNILFVKNYLSESNKIIDFCAEIHNPVIIFFNGYLKENRPFEFPNLDEIIKTFEINFLIPFELTKKMLNNNLKIKKFVYISSFASVKARYKNYIYGSSKRLLEDSIRQEDLSSYLIVRFGKINSNFSANHNKSYFDLEINYAAKKLYQLVENGNGIVYPNSITRILALIIKLTPKSVIKKINL